MHPSLLLFLTSTGDLFFLTKATVNIQQVIGGVDEQRHSTADKRGGGEGGRVKVIIEEVSMTKSNTNWKE